MMNCVDKIIFCIDLITHMCLGSNIRALFGFSSDQTQFNPKKSGREHKGNLPFFWDMRCVILIINRISLIVFINPELLAE